MNFRMGGGEDDVLLRRALSLGERPSGQRKVRLSVAALLHRGVGMVARGVGMGSFRFPAG
jgi:hypothetical protein